MFTNLTIRRNLVQPEKPQPVQPSALTTQRFTLSGGKEAGMNRMPVRLPANRKQIQVVSGCAWITCNGEDVILYPGTIRTGLDPFWWRVNKRHFQDKWSVS